MAEVFAGVSMSLDGYIAPEGMDMEHADDPGYKGWMRNWSALQEWAFGQKFFRESLGLGEGGETGVDNQLLEDMSARTGAYVMGKRMFEGGERFWPDEAPFHAPVFVLTHTGREPWERPGGTTFYFVTNGVQSAVDQAREAAGGMDVRVSGGANAIAQCINHGLLNTLWISLVPVLFSGGTPLLADVDAQRVTLEVTDVIESPLVTHLRYEMSGRAPTDPTSETSTG